MMACGPQPLWPRNMASAIQASRESVVRSPREAATGAAMLSGLQPPRREHTTTATMMRARTNDAMLPVRMALEHSSMKLSMLRPAPVAKLIATATQEARKPTTMAWHWISAMFPRTSGTAVAVVSSVPRLACVERREASVISRLPFRPSNAGTRMNISGISRKTSHSATPSSTTPALTIPKPASTNGKKICAAVSMVDSGAAFAPMTASAPSHCRELASVGSS
mmetsp:Transcript_59695/g.134545  ORF Transcript_59695/g.134545 Transcript_59695/m.134545 type:complete len:223 (+) Transcript_59695:775-1443(+)